MVTKLSIGLSNLCDSQIQLNIHYRVLRLFTFVAISCLFCCPSVEPVYVNFLVSHWTKTLPFNQFFIQYIGMFKRTTIGIGIKRFYSHFKIWFANRKGGNVFDVEVYWWLDELTRCGQMWRWFFKLFQALGMLAHWRIKFLSLIFFQN